MSINWESHTTTEQIAHRAADRYGFTPAEESAQLAEWSQLGISFGPPPDKCDIRCEIAQSPRWVRLDPIKDCDCLSCQKRHKQPRPGNKAPALPADAWTGLRNGLVITAAILTIVWVAFKLGVWQ